MTTNFISLEDFRNGFKRFDKAEDISPDFFEGPGYIFQHPHHGYYIAGIYEIADSILPGQPYGVSIGNDDRAFEQWDDAVEFLYWDFIWPEYCDMELMTDREFDRDNYPTPQQCEKLLSLGFVDTSWHNDACPSFSLPLHPDTDIGEGFHVRIWCDFPEEDDREYSEPRFAVHAMEDGCTPKDYIAVTDIFDTAVIEALAYIAGDEVLGEEDCGSDRQVEAQNRFFIELEKHLSPARFAQLEDYCMRATTPEMIAAGLAAYYEENNA